MGSEMCIRDSIYDTDPNIDSQSTKYDFISYQDAIEKRLGVMDTTALSICMENDLPIRVFDITNSENLVRIINGESIGSLVSESD